MSIDDVTDLTPRVRYVSGVSQTVFAYPFPIFQDADLVVDVDGIPQVLTTHYTVSGEGEDLGGNVTFLTGQTSGAIVTIYRNTVIERLSDQQQNGPIASSVFNDEFDKAYTIMQELKAKIGRAIRFPFTAAQTDAASELSPLSNWYSKFLYIGSTGLLEAAATISGVVALTQSVIAQLLNPQTTAESAVSATVVNYHYPVGCVDRYGTNSTPGTTNMAPAFQAAVNVCKTTGLELTYGATWPYLLTSAINMTCAVGSTPYSFVIRNTGHAGAFTTTAPWAPSIVVKHTGAAFDMTGSLGVTWLDVTIGTDAGVTQPVTCFLLARNSDGNSSHHRFRNVKVLGYFSGEIVYNYGAEEEQYDACQMFNYSTTAGAKAVVITAYNIRSRTSTFTTIATGVRSTIDHKFIGGSYMMFSSGATADCFYLDAAQSVKIIAPWMKCGTQAAGGRALVYVDMTNAPSNFLSLDKVTGEQGFEPSYAVRFASGTGTCSNVCLRDSVLPNATRMLSTDDADVDFSELNVSNCWEQASHGIQIPGDVSGGFIEFSGPVIIGLLKWATLSGFSESWTITTMTDCNLIDRTVTSTWTPGTGALTITGALTTLHNRFSYDGKYMDVQVTFSAATSIACAAGVQLTGLPRASKDTAGAVFVVNQNTPALIGCGYVSGSSMYLPAISVTTESVLIRARYRIS